MLLTYQKCFIEEELTEENTGLTFDIMQECKINKASGLIVMIDFAKAFVMEIHGNYLQNLHFDEVIIEWAKVQKYNSSSFFLIRMVVSKGLIGIVDQQRRLEKV